MAEQSLLWTALPNGWTDAHDGLRVSVVITPRLDPQADAPELSSFATDWTDWPATLEGAVFEVHYGGSTVTIPMSQRGGTSRIDDTIGLPDTHVWKALFTKSLLVRPGDYVDNTGKDVLSYDTVAVDSLVSGLYGQLAAAADGNLPTVTGLLNVPGWDALVSLVDTIDRQWTNEKTGQRDTARQFRAYRRGEFAGAAPMLKALNEAQLFHTPPSTPTTSTVARDDDKRITATTTEYAKAALPAKTDFSKMLDFHQILASMNPYPTVLRRLGIVVDLVIDPAEFTQSADAPLSVTVTFEPGLTVPVRPAVSPPIHVALSGDSFAAVPSPTPASGLRTPDGLLDLDPKSFRLLNSDVDGAALKVMNFARSLSRFSVADQRVDSVTRHEKDAAAPALRTAGLMLVHRRRRDFLKGVFASNTAKNTKAQDVFDNKPGATPPDLWADDVLRGFRIDIWDSKTNSWHSLCRREADYLLSKGALVVSPASGEEEGVVKLAATKSSDPASNKDLLWLHEALTSWTGWSLTAPPPGRAISPDDTVDKSKAQTDAELPPGLDFQSRFRAVRGSLPRLRFGRHYWIRARAVDLAGNSLPFRETDFGPEDPKENAQPFLRFEPVAAPVVALVKRAADDTTELPAEGESMNTVAIRSFNDTPPDNAVPTTQSARRYLVPPQVSVRDAELHGALDNAGVVDAATFAMLANEKDKDPTDPTSALVQDVVPMSGPLDTAPASDHTFAVYREGHDLTYLPDPLATVVAVRIFGHPDVNPDDILAIRLYPSGAWPEAQPFKVDVIEKAGAVPSFDEATRTLTVPLAKAERAKVRLSMMLDDGALRDVMGVWRWLPGAATPQLERLAITGQHWMLTPWTTLDVVHAVQRPLIDPKFEKLQIDRDTGATSAIPRFAADVSIKSTDRVDLLAEWHEPNDDPASAATAAQGADIAKGDTAFTVKITTPDEYAQRLDGHQRGGIADHEIVAPDVITVGLERTDFRANKAHEFHDTRYRRIEYWLHGTTKFREFLPSGVLTVDEGSGPVPSEKNISVTGPRQVTWIPSSAPPPAPDVLYVVPTFGWERVHAEDGTDRSWRRGGGLRIYLNRPWCATGYGEMLAVVLAPASFTGNPELQPKAHPYNSHVTQWGNDPIWSSPNVPGMAPHRDAFPLARTAADPSGAWLPPFAPATEADQPSGPFPVTGLGDWQAPVDIAPHDVHYDDQRQLWYCDIEINPGSSYWPFIRLALARYQPVSVGGAELSEVVLADFMPLTADRSLAVSPGATPNSRHVRVSGHTYTESSGHVEAHGQGGVSLINPLTHKTETLVPTNVSPTSAVEVWVEKLDPTKGEDFGWERFAGAVITPTPPDGGIRFPVREALQPVERVRPQPGLLHRENVLRDFVPAAELARGNDLVAGRKFTELVSEGLLEKLFFVKPLWDGTVTLPERQEGDRYRLVVAEYEEYIVDDSRPYDQWPTAKGRRMVYVEHLEL